MKSVFRSFNKLYKLSLILILSLGLLGTILRFFSVPCTPILNTLLRYYQLDDVLSLKNVKAHWSGKSFLHFTAQNLTLFAGNTKIQGQHVNVVFSLYRLVLKGQLRVHHVSLRNISFENLSLASSFNQSDIPKGLDIQKAWQRWCDQESSLILDNIHLPYCVHPWHLVMRPEKSRLLINAWWPQGSAQAECHVKANELTAHVIWRHLTLCDTEKTLPAQLGSINFSSSGSGQVSLSAQKVMGTFESQNHLSGPDIEPIFLKTHGSWQPQKSDFSLTATIKHLPDIHGRIICFEDDFLKNNSHGALGREKALIHLTTKQPLLFDKLMKVWSPQLHTRMKDILGPHVDLQPLEETRVWLKDNLSEGKILPLNAFFLLQKQVQGSSWKIYPYIAHIPFENMSVLLFNQVPKVTSAKGTAYLGRCLCWIPLSQGTLQQQRLQQGRIHITGLDGPDQTAFIQVNASLDIENLWHALNNPSLPFHHKVNGFQTLSPQGAGQGTLNVTFPISKILNPSQIDFDAKIAWHQGSGSFEFTPQQPWKLHNPRLTVLVSNKILEIAGNVNIEHIPTQIRWSQNFTGQELTQLIVTCNGQHLSSLFSTEELVDLSGPLTFSFKQQGQRRQALVDATSAKLTIHPLLHEKSPAKKLYLRVIEKSPDVWEAQVTGHDALEIQAKVYLKEGQVIQSHGTIVTPFTKLNVSVHQTDTLYTIDIQGPSLYAHWMDDFLQNFMSGTHPQWSVPSFALTWKIALCQLDHQRRIYNFLGHIKAKNQGPLVFETRGGIVAGGTKDPSPFSLRFSSVAFASQTGKVPLWNFLLRSQNANTFLSLFNLSLPAQTGVMTLKGRLPFSRKEAFKLKIDNVLVQEAPAISKFFDLLLPLGWPNLLAENLFFPTIKATGRIKSSSIVQLSTLNAVSSSMGVSFSGDIFTPSSRYPTGQLHLKGFIVPFAMIQQILGHIPLVGPLVSQATSGLTSIAFTVGGPLNNPQYHVNPLTFLPLLNKIPQLFPLYSQDMEDD